MFRLVHQMAAPEATFALFDCILFEHVSIGRRKDTVLRVFIVILAVFLGI